MSDGPIALFDSGFGGLTVARAVIDLMGDEDVVYLGDTARYPYGPRPLDEVREFARQIADELVHRWGAKLLIVACNTAAAAALDELQARYDIPVVGVIEPGARAVVSATTTGRIGVIGTVGTIGSGAYQQAVADLAPDIELCALACPGFVEFVERGEFESEQVHVLAQRLLAPAIEADIDTLLLGCTHYPYLARTLADVMGRDVVLVSSADETAFEARRLLDETGRGRKPGLDGPDGAGWADGADGADDSPGHRPSRTFLTTGDVDWFQHLGSQLLGPELASAHRIVLS